MVFTLAKEGGFTEEQVMEMPVYRVNSYYWAALRSHDCWTIRPSAPVTKQIDHLLAFASSLIDTPDEA